MNNAVKIDTKYGIIKGGWTSNGLSSIFQGAVFENDKNILAIDFSVPYSFFNKYGEQAVLEEIKISQSC